MDDSMRRMVIFFQISFIVQFRLLVMILFLMLFHVVWHSKMDSLVRLEYHCRLFMHWVGHHVLYDHRCIVMGGYRVHSFVMRSHGMWGLVVHNLVTNFLLMVWGNYFMMNLFMLNYMGLVMRNNMSRLLVNWSVMMSDVNSRLVMLRDFTISDMGGFMVHGSLFISNVG